MMYLKQVSRWVLGLGCCVMTSVFANESFVINYFDNFLAIQADFTQTVHAQKKKEVSTGVLKVRKKSSLHLKPGFYFDYLSPYRQKIISDGTRLWHYDADLMQVVIKHMSDFEKSSPIFIIFGERQINDFFTIKTMTNERKYLLTPKNRQGYELKSMELEFSGKQLSRIITNEVSGQRIELQLRNIRPNEAFPNNTFSFSIPKGVDVIDETR